MKTTQLLLIAAAAYLLTRRNGIGQLIPTRPAAPPPATATTGGGATRITLPGIGTYENVYGGGVSFSVDPRFLEQIGLAQPTFGATPDGTISDDYPDVWA